ncbi:MAG: DUF3142 domain-containing protein [Verrucomicrobia bacterium]|nr:DUF3142 domain-containing protein [Verrucomicrobiota bacterium]
MCRLRLFLLACLCVSAGCRREELPAFQGLAQAAYVWRQGWDAAAVASLEPGYLPAEVGELIVLVGECGLGHPPRAVRPPWPQLLATGRPISLAVRIGTGSVLGGPQEPNLQEGFTLLNDGLVDARAAGLTVTQVQVDFDCPVRLLSAYAERLLEFKRSAPDLAVTITALPTWLQAPGCGQLFKSVDGFTLQVHATQRPSAKEPARLVSAVEALRWIAQAESLYRQPFRVALPTYAYVACYARSGTFLGVRAESRELPTGTAFTQLMPTETQEVATVLATLKSGRHPLVRGVDWFRLPFPGDRQNWTRAGLGQMVRGETLAARCRVELRPQGALTDLAVYNPTEQPLALPPVLVRWTGAGWVGADAAVGWETAAPAGNTVRFTVDPRAGFLAPGERRVLGWLRLTQPAASLTAEVASEQLPR